MNKAIGIIGGMGPMATCDLFRKIIELTDVSCDQEHIPVYIDNNTNIPDRTAAILTGGESPVPELVKSAVKLQNMGADVLIMPCNTAHYFYDRILPFIDIPLLHMPEETAKILSRNNRKTVGLLATDGTCQSGVYSTVFDRYGIRAIIPEAEDQQAVMDIIYKGIKAGNFSLDLTAFQCAINRLLDAGAEQLVLGCTELPVAFERFQIEAPVIDPTAVLAAAAIRFVGKPVKEYQIH